MDPYCTDKFQWFKKYVEALEEERRKILVFKRELPFCLQLVTQAIDAWKHQMVTEFNSYYNETSNDGPVLEEFIPLKRSYEDTQQQQSGENHERSKKEGEKLGKMPDWLRSVQLWNQEPDIIVKEDLSPKSLVVEKKKGAFNPFSRDKRATGGIMAAPLAVGAAASSTAETTGGGKEKEGEVQRKTRRCWSPELHRRFVHALRQLGGSHVATPKQIRELMKVDSLTNDEVKSHLQKYRLHMRRPSPTIQSTNAQATQFVFVGGIWVRPEFAAVAVQPGEVTGCAAQIYTPVAAPAVQMHYNHSEQSPMGPSHGTGNDHSIGDDANSFHTTTTTTTSSSSHVTTSPHF